MFLSTLYHYFFGKVNDFIKSVKHTNRYSDIIFKNVSSSVQLRNLSGDAKLVNRYSDINIKNISSDTNILNKFGDVNIVNKTYSVVVKNV